MSTSKFWSPIVAELEPYVPGEQPASSQLKLNTNESPFPPSPKVFEAISRQAVDDLRLYPDPSSVALRKCIADYYSTEEQSLNMEQVFVGNGSDEVLAHSFRAFFSGRTEPLLFPDISYSFYRAYCNLFEIEFEQVPLDEQFEIDLQLYGKKNAGIIFPNPNAPTSIFKPLAAIEKLLESNLDSVVIVDEAYIDFGGVSAVSLVNRFKNLLVTQTLSKSRSLAGSRLGFAIGSSELISALMRVKDSFNSYPVDRLSEAAGRAAFEDQAYFRNCCDTLIANREWSCAQLESLGFEVLPSKANFVMAKPGRLSALEIFEKLRARNVFVRYFNKPRISEYLRITIGTKAEMQELIETLKAIGL